MKSFIKLIINHPITYVLVSTFMFAVATLPEMPSGFFSIFGVGFLGIFIWRTTIYFSERELTIEERRKKIRGY